MLATPTAAVTAAQQLIPGEQQLERLTREVGPFQAWLDMQWPSLRTPFLPKVTGALARQLGGPLAGPPLRKVAEFVTPTQFGPKGAAEAFLQPDVLIGGVKPLTGVARGVAEVGLRGARAVEREVVPAARRVAAEEVGALRITKSKYRGEEGFSLSGKDPVGRDIRIFSKTRQEAEIVRDNIKAGREPFAAPSTTELAAGQAEMPVVAAKEPWQMTRAEFSRLAPPHPVNPHRRGTTAWSNFERRKLQNAATELGRHKVSVITALSEGKPVPAEVLADYPDLVAAVKPAAPTSISRQEAIARSQRQIQAAEEGRKAVAEAEAARGLEPVAAGQAEMPVEVAEGKDVISRLFANLGRSQWNAIQQRAFLHDVITPKIVEKYGDAPVMSIFNRTLGGKEPLLEVHTAGWQPRLEAMGLKKVGEGAFAARYSLSKDLPALAAAKEPWMMTRAEFANLYPIPSGADAVHRSAVFGALYQGKPVLPEVLADYPDLVAAAKSVAKPVAEPAPGLPIPGVREPTEAVAPRVEIPIESVRRIERTMQQADDVYGQRLSQARAEFEQATASARAAFEQVDRPAFEAYHQALSQGIPESQARAAYSRATAPALATYQETLLPAQSAMMEKTAAIGRAFDQARARIKPDLLAVEEAAQQLRPGVERPIPGIREVTETAVERGPGERLVAEPEVARARLEEARAAAAAGAPPIKPPIEPPIAEAAAPLPPDMPSSQKVFSRISFDEPRPGLVERLRHGWHDFNRAAFDDLHPIDEFVKAAQKGGPELSFEENPYIWARMLRGNTSKANVMLERGTFGKQYWKMEAGKAVPDFKGPGLEQILQPVREPTEWRDFSTYMTSKRAVELSGRKIKTGIAPEDALGAITELEAKHPDFPQIAERLYSYQNQLLDYGQEMGLLSKDLVAKLKTYKSYVPFQRVFEEIQARGFMGKKMANIALPIKRIKGSERPIINPLESIVKNTYLIVSASDRNQVGIMMANLATDNPELAGLFRKIPTPTARVAQVTAKELGISVEGLTAAENEAVFNIFRPSLISRENVVTVMVDGKRQFFQADPDLYRGLLALDRDSMGMIGQFLSYPAKWLRAGATLSPEFMVRNPLRDQMTAFVYSKYGFMPGVDWLRGTAHIVGKSDEFLLYKMSGAERSMLVSMDREYLQHSFKEIVEGKGFTDYVKHPLDLLQIGSEFGEKGTRMGEFVKGIKAGATPLEAGFSSREVTLDFAKMGTTARAVNNITAFFNANIRAWDMMIRSFRNRPIHTSAMTFLGITVPSILLYAANRDNPRYQEIPQWQKDLFWIVIVPDGPIIRIPKPFELGILFGSMPERFLEYLDQKDPEMLKEAMGNAIEAGMPGILPTAILPIVENMTNYSFFRQAPIVSATRKEMPPELQYGRYTPEVLKKLGEWVNYSPSKIENILNGYTGGLGRYAMDILDASLTGTGIIPTIPGPSPTLADVPVVKAFIIRDPYGSSSAAIDRFYKQLDEYERHERYLKEMLRLGEREKFDTYKAKHGDVLFFYDYERNDYYSASARYFRQIARQLSEMRKKEQEVYDSPSLTPQEKRQKIDAINKGMTEIARGTLTKYGIGNRQVSRSGPSALRPSRAEMQAWVSVPGR